MIKEIIFDCFGVLTQDGWTTFLQEYGTNETIEELRYLNRSVDSGLISQNDFLDAICKLTGATKESAIDIMINSYHPEIAVFELVRKLKQSYKIGLISNISSPLTDYLPTAPMELFDEQTLSYQARVAKPAPEIFQLHLNKTGTEPGEAIFIDDRQSNCEGARAVGMEAILFKDVVQLSKDLAKRGIKL